MLELLRLLSLYEVTLCACFRVRLLHGLLLLVFCRARQASRKAKIEAAAEHAGRVAMAAELRRAKDQADVSHMAVDVSCVLALF